MDQIRLLDGITVASITHGEVSRASVINTMLVLSGGNGSIQLLGLNFSDTNGIII